MTIGIKKDKKKKKNDIFNQNKTKTYFQFRLSLKAYASYFLQAGAEAGIQDGAVPDVLPGDRVLARVNERSLDL